MRTAPLALTGLVILGLAASPAAATKKKPKPITKSYDVQAPAPDPTNYLGQGGVETYSVCAQNVPNSFQSIPFKAPAIGKIKVTLTGFYGDWDLLITDAEDSELGYGGSSGLSSPAAPTDGDESTTVKIKKKGATYHLIACNWAGSPNAKLTYTFTYA